MLELFNARIWALDAATYNSYKAIILARLGKGMPALDPEAARPAPTQIKHFAVAGLAGEQDGMQAAWEVLGAMAAMDSNRPGAPRKVAVLPLIGTMTKRGGMCTRGTADLAADLEALYADPSISSIVIEIDTGGGAVDGTEALAAVINRRNKPVMAWVNGMAASAGYWIASQCDQIMLCSKTTAYVGSIGVLAMLMDQSQMLEKAGVKVQIVRSSKAVDKARPNSIEPLTDEQYAEFVSQLDIIHDLFISTVKQGRGPLSDDNFTGKVYHGSEAKKRGLADSFGTLQDAVLAADKLAKSGQFGPNAPKKASISINSFSNNTQSTMLKFPKLAAMLGITAGAADSEVTPEQMQAAEDRILASETENASLLAQIEQLKADKAALEAGHATALETLEATHKTALETAEATHKAALEEKQAEITTLEAFKVEQTTLAHEVDASNSFDKGNQPKTEWEKQADLERAKANKRNSGK